jgi:hypothetical protein
MSSFFDDLRQPVAAGLQPFRHLQDDTFGTTLSNCLDQNVLFKLVQDIFGLQPEEGQLNRSQNSEC